MLLFQVTDYFYILTSTIPNNNVEPCLNKKHIISKLGRPKIIQAKEMFYGWIILIVCFGLGILAILIYVVRSQYNNIIMVNTLLEI